MQKQRKENLYTVEQDGQPVAQAMAISQAEAVRLYVESVQQPTMTARLSSPLEARTLAGLPLLQREPAAVDTRTADLFNDAPAAPVSPIVGAYFSEHGVGIGRPDADHVVDAAEMAQEVAAAPQGELVPSALSTAAPTVSPAPAAVELPDADEPTQAERMAGAYAAGVELGKQGALRWGKEFLAADDELTAGLSDEDGNAVNDELLRGFEFGRAAVEPKTEPPAARGAGKPVAKYRHTDGSTWTGRGLKPRWLVQALEDGKTLDEFLIDQA